MPTADLQIRYETKELRLLFEITQALEGASDITGHLDSALELMAKYTGMMRGTLTLLEANGQDIALEASYGLKHDEQARVHYKLGEGVTGKVIETGLPMMVPKASQDPLFLNRSKARDLQKEEISFLCVPILLAGKAVGALSADRIFADSVCLEEDLRLLQIIASLIARAVRVRMEFNAMHSAVLDENRKLQTLLRGDFNTERMVGTSSPLRAVLEEAAQVAASSATVLIRGESGTGKEMIASIIHDNSPRAGKPFIKINCAALPEGLVESELFGYERGAFTGAVGNRKGRFEMAHGGTLFLDEIGDMTPMTQAKLLRVIQEKEFERVGGTGSIRVDVRLIAATNRDLEEMVASGKFRQDLYYRLCVFPLIIPPLRERKEDIMPLVAHFIDKYAGSSASRTYRVTPAAVSALMTYDWPGNIRELENVIERAVILSSPQGTIDTAQLPSWFRASGNNACAATCPCRQTLAETLAAVEKNLIIKALEETSGNMARAAQLLDISERIMGLRMKRYGLQYKTFRNAETAPLRHDTSHESRDP